MREQRMVPVAVLGQFQARLLAARLGAEGILWQLRGASSVYPFAPVEVLVNADEVDQAREVLALEPLDDPVASEPLVDPAASDARGEPAALGPLGRAAADPAGGDALRVGHRHPRARHRPGRTRLWVWVGIVAIVVALALQVSHVG